MDARSQEKKQRLEEALERGVVMVHLDARRAGVLVPQKFRGDYHLRLNLSYSFDPPDLAVGDWGARQTLSFNRTPFKVALPWQAIFAITGNSASGQAWLYPEEMPEELLEAAARSQGLTGEQLGEFEVVPPLEPEAPGLSVVSSAEEAGAEPKPRFVPRLVKDEPASEVLRLAVAPPPEEQPETPKVSPLAPASPLVALPTLAPASPLVALPPLAEARDEGPAGAEVEAAPRPEPSAEELSASAPLPEDGKPKRTHLRLVK